MLPSSSTEHCLACLAALRLSVKPSRLSPEMTAAQDKLYAASLTKHGPAAVKAACQDWATDPARSGFPELAQLLALVREHDKLLEVRARPALPSPVGREKFGDRLQRLGFRVAQLATVEYSLWSPFLAAHDAQPSIRDEHLSDGLARLLRGERASPRDYKPKATSDAEILAMWRRNDELGADLAAHPRRYVCGDVLARVFAGFEAKRRQEHPELAARYYAERKAVEPSVLPPSSVEPPPGPKPLSFTAEEMRASIRRLNALPDLPRAAE